MVEHVPRVHNHRSTIANADPATANTTVVNIHATTHTHVNTGEPVNLHYNTRFTIVIAHLGIPDNIAKTMPARHSRVIMAERVM
ncbi:hypothetical protein DPMN_029500 [Dreissena polymorpha]|uniref:Uncharacterized protein n=1 Tax=Dreissena polymorpha TaxID=45954 RepID=A0A9D4LYP3_DREPO|nr:hypothetical protein DPMN_029500 [Dreissena polymorpha]